MCGITGIVSLGGKLENIKSRMDASIRSIAHRGPDDSGSWIDDRCALGHTRLSILDLSNAAAQPMASDNADHVIVFNGEIYNYKKLWKAYGQGNLTSSGDTEVLLKLYAELGNSLWEKLNGMFGLALLDSKADALHLVRDRAGIKPLYYYHDGNTFVFASEVKAIKELIGESLEIDKRAIHEWLYFGTSLGTQSMYRQVKKLLPGQRLTLDLTNGKVSLSTYWKPKANEFSGSTSVHSNELQGLLENAVQRQLVSDVPVGVFLSGGVDSSCIAAFAAKHYGSKISTYSVDFDYDNGNNELPIAKNFAETLGTEHHEMRIEGRDLAPVVRKMIVHHDSPFSDAANIPLYLLCEAVKDSVKVVLQGDGGDELFAGYKRYRTLANLKKWKRVANVQKVTGRIQKKSKEFFQRSRYSRALLKNSMHEIFASLLTVEDEQDNPQDMFKEEFRREVVLSSWNKRYQTVYERYSLFDPAKAMLMTDFEVILPDVFLEKVDKSTMAASVEVRVPFLDNDVIDFAHGLSSKSLMGPGHQKWLLKKSLEGVVPHEILYGQKKGFGVPYGKWVGAELKELFWDEILSFDKRQPTVLNIREIEERYKSHTSGQREYGFWLWKAMNFAVWCNESNVEFV